MKFRTGAPASGAMICAIVLAACSSAIGPTTDEPVGEATSAIGSSGCDGNGNSNGGNDNSGGDDGNLGGTIVDTIAGGIAFNHALPGTNGRSCATCHVPEDHFTLTPEHVKALYAKNPNDPLFNPIDADDPTAAVPTYNHLMAGLVRVAVPLADNLDEIDANGNVITNATRTIAVWRGVPTTENVAFSGPYQYDGRNATLQIQADGALLTHSQMNPPPSPQVLNQIADFELSTYSDLTAFQIGESVQQGKTPHPDPELDPLTRHFPAGSDEAAGQALFQQICARCHGSSTTQILVDQSVNTAFFPVQHADGTIDISGFNAIGIALPTTFRSDLKNPEHMGLYGISLLDGLRQLGKLPPVFPANITFPEYRIRFYTDATRTQKQVDMPPAPPGIGVDLAPMPYSVDPGRALTTGNSYDWEGFKVLEPPRDLQDRPLLPRRQRAGSPRRARHVQPNPLPRRPRPEPALRVPPGDPGRAPGVDVAHREGADLRLPPEAVIRQRDGRAAPRPDRSPPPTKTLRRSPAGDRARRQSRYHPTNRFPDPRRGSGPHRIPASATSRPSSTRRPQGRL